MGLPFRIYFGLTIQKIVCSGMYSNVSDKSGTSFTTSSKQYISMTNNCCNRLNYRANTDDDYLTKAVFLFLIKLTTMNLFSVCCITNLGSQA